MLVVLFMAVIGHVCYASFADSVGQTRRNLASNVTDRPGFISIDCGATEEHYDSELGILYKTDSEFTDAGENKNISSVLWNSEYDNGWPHLQTLRSFPNGTKNCYTLKLEQGKNNKYLIRAMFLYGNYDNLSKIHKFDVYIGVNYFKSIRSDRWLLEAIHSPTSDTIYVCLVNIGGVPFINSLELRLLDNSTYPTTPRTALINVVRQDFGKLTAQSPLPAYAPLSRYRDDAYDRIWTLIYPSPFDNTSKTTKTLAVIKEDNGNVYRPPAMVLRDGVIARTNTTPLQEDLPLNPDFYYHVYFYFAEIESHRGTRKFDIYLNGVASKFVTLDDYLQPLTITAERPIAGPVTFSLVARRDSDHPPILNAFEVNKVLPLSFFETNEEDVNAIIDIKKIYGIVKDDWQGDPCFPNFIWSGLACNKHNPPRIITLSLTSHDLDGAIAPSLANLTVPESLDLSYNKLKGTVPEFLGNLPSLKAINLSGNNLSGSVPPFIVEKQKAGALSLSLCGNIDLVLLVPCDHGVKPKTKKTRNTTLVIAVSVASVIAISVILGLIVNYLWRRRRAVNEVISRVSVSRVLVFKTKTREFKYSEIVSITDNFKRVIGEGGFGKLYHGILKDGSEVAVKLLSASSRQGIKQFRAEAEILSNIHHKNLVSFLGYCEDSNAMALVYEYMANGDLQQHISDFEISRMFANESDSNVTTPPADTIAYLDPKYRSAGILNTKSDVYSFRVVLLQLITEKSPIIRGPINMDIASWVKNLIEKGDIESIIDPRLKRNYNISSSWKMVGGALACAQEFTVERQDITYIHFELEEGLKMELDPERYEELKMNVYVSSPSAR